MLKVGRIHAVTSRGMVLCLGSGCAFGTMGIFGKLAYRSGATVGTLLTVRFVLAAAMVWTLLLIGGAGCEVRLLGRRDVVHGLAVGACGYAIPAAFFFAALERMGASLVSLLVYSFPVLVAVGAFCLRRERIDGRRVATLGVAVCGLGFVVAGAGVGRRDPLGIGLAACAAVVYAAYVLVSEGIGQRIGSRVLSALICTGAAAPLALGSALLRELHPGRLTPAGWGWLVGLAAVSTVAAIGLFLLGVQHVGATRASMCGMVEPVTTVVLAALVFGETLTPVQVAGAVLMLSAVLALRSDPRCRDTPKLLSASTNGPRDE